MNRKRGSRLSLHQERITERLESGGLRKRGYSLQGVSNKRSNKKRCGLVFVTQRLLVLVLPVTGLHFLLPVVIHPGMIELKVIPAHEVDYFRP